MSLTPEMIMSIAVGLATGAGSVYAAIRADLATLHARTMAAHERIDFIQARVFK